MSNARWLLGYVIKLKWAYAIGIVLLIVRICANLTLTGVQKFIIDDIFGAGNYGLVFPVMLVFALAVIVANAFGVIAARFLDGNSFKMYRMLAADMLRAIHRLPTKAWHKERTAKFVHHFTSDAHNVAWAVTNIPNGLQHVLTVIVVGVVLWLANPALLFLLTGVSIVYVFLGKFFTPRVKAMAKRVQDDRTNMLVHIEEGISASREMIAFHRETWERTAFERLFRSYFDNAMKETKLDNKQALLSDPLRWAAMLLILGLGGYQVMNESLTLGMFVIAFQYSTQFMDGVKGLYDFSLDYAMRMASAERIREVTDIPEAEAGKQDAGGELRSITFDRVRFRYSDETDDVLKAVSFVIPGDKKIAFVGTSGGGKSTIAQLLVRFFEPDEGEILMNGTRLGDIAPSDWNGRAAILFQEPFLFPDTIRNNLVLDRDDLTDQAIEAACRAAEIHLDISALPDGYDTVLGERGVTLSGGQRQRLAIARALMRNPDLLVMDEATSALDLETERKVQRNIDRLRQGKCTVIIAHRLSTIRDADRIYVLDRGSVAEHGSHEELLEREGVYRRLMDVEQRLEAGA